MKGTLLPTTFAAATALTLGAAIAPANAFTFTIGGGIEVEILGDACPVAYCAAPTAEIGYAGGGAIVDTAPLSVENEYLTPGTDSGTEGNIKSYLVNSDLDSPTGAITDSMFNVDGKFEFFWGSIDTYNEVTFSFDGDPDVVFTGENLADELAGSLFDLGVADEFGNYDEDLYVRFMGDFNKVSLGITDDLTDPESGIAFETAYAVPEPASLLGLGVVGMLSGTLLRKRNEQEADA